MKSLQLTKPHLLVVVGIPGAGKTFFAEQFADTFNAPLISPTKISQLGQLEDVDDITEHFMDQLYKTKQTIILDGRGATRSERSYFSSQAQKRGYATLFVWIQTDPMIAKQRATKSHHLNTRTAEQFEQELHDFSLFNSSDPFTVISGRHTFATQAKHVLSRLAAPRTTAATPQPPQRSTQTPPPRTVPQKPSGRITIK